MVRGFGTLLVVYDKAFSQRPIFGSTLQHELWLNTCVSRCVGRTSWAEQGQNSAGLCIRAIDL